MTRPHETRYRWAGALAFLAAACFFTVGALLASPVLLLAGTANLAFGAAVLWKLGLLGERRVAALPVPGDRTRRG